MGPLVVTHGGRRVGLAASLYPADASARDAGDPLVADALEAAAR